ncbi:D-alanyl-D-alanine carboxypeptidase [Candidatus Woesebacteria bacterium]|nr:D-alanyl-D-alanine carboxypeptidase [Candidatus Woesebacteria bacterium]
MKLHGFSKDQFFYVVALSFFSIGIFTLVVSGTSNRPDGRQDSIQEETTAFTPLPVIREKANFPVLSAQSALAVDLTSGKTLYEKAADTPLLPASTTKIVTALVAMDYYPLDSILKVNGINVDGQKMKLIEGEEITISDLLHGLLMYSANDAAEVLAQNFPGGRDFFIFAMNLKAHQLGMKNSYFINPSGLDGDYQATTARDLVRASTMAMKNPTFAQIVATENKVVKSVDGKIVHKLANINKLLKDVEGVLGVKTGWTENARENLVTYLERNGRHIIIALLGSQDRFGETKELINWIFENYEWQDTP